jgi:GrpB-like predicted nucleotidyltransferase (UPF0157 family)
MTETTRDKKPNRNYSLSAYDPDWVNQFEIRASILRNVLGGEMIDVQHIGSTSVAGLVAKPQIDILVIVKDLDHIKNLYDEMTQVGFTPRGNYTGYGEEYFTEDEPDGRRIVSIHVLPLGHQGIELFLSFRDDLRVHDEERDLYAAAKKEMYEKYPEDYYKYGKGKARVIEEIRSRAKLWYDQK